MSSASRNLVLALLALMTGSGFACARTEVTEKARAAPALRVCADPNNLPFSNERGQGFENALAEMIAGELGTRVEYTWWAQRRGFFRNTLNAGLCDVVLGVPTSFELAMTTRPYYRSTYVFVTRRGGPSIGSFDDPVLRSLRIGVQLVGDDFSNTPPAHALANRGIVQQVRGYSLYGDYRQPDPPSRIVHAVAEGEVDVAVVWGPLAGYFAARQQPALEIAPVAPQIDLPFLPFVFDIAMGVRRGDTERLEMLNRFIESHHPEIAQLLARYRVPTL